MIVNDLRLESDNAFRRHTRTQKEKEKKRFPLSSRLVWLLWLLCIRLPLKWVQALLLSLAHQFTLQMPHNSIQYMWCPFFTHTCTHQQKPPSYSFHSTYLHIDSVWFLLAWKAIPTSLTHTHIFFTHNDEVDHFRGSLKPKHSINFPFILFFFLAVKMGKRRRWGFIQVRAVMQLVE